MLDREDDDQVYLVVVNHEGQYSLWSKDQSLPPGWRSVGKDGSKAECLGYIEKVWTDMRPLSLRKQMDAVGGPRQISRPGRRARPSH